MSWGNGLDCRFLFVRRNVMDEICNHTRPQISCIPARDSFCNQLTLDTIQRGDKDSIYYVNESSMYSIGMNVSRDTFIS